MMLPSGAGEEEEEHCAWLLSVSLPQSCRLSSSWAGLGSQRSAGSPGPAHMVTPRRILLVSRVGERNRLQSAEDRINDLILPN